MPAALFAFAGSAMLANAASAQDFSLEEIVVTAQFRAQNLQDTPIAITAVSSSMLEARGQTSIYQIASQAPNVTLKPQPQGNGIGLIAFIRGVGQIDFNYALEPGVGIYVDDIYIPTLSSSLLDLMDLDRVEVLRGPQGTLAGKNSIGGAIKLFSAKPTGEDKGSLQVTYGSYDRIEARGFADLAISDTLFARVSAMTMNRDGYVTVLDYGLTHPGSNVPSNNNAGKSGVLGTLGGESKAAARLALRWQPSDRLDINISGDVTSEDNDSGAEVLRWANKAGTTPDGIPWLVGLNGMAIPADCRFVPYGANSCDTTPAGYDPKFISYSNFLDARTPTTQAPYKPYSAIPGNKFDGWGLHGNVRYEISDTMELTWFSSWREYDSTWGMDQDSTPVPIAQLNQTLHHKAWSQELRLNGEFGDGLFDYTVGGFYFDQDGTLEARVDLNYAGIDFIHGPDSTPSTSKALFFNGTLHPTDNWNFSAGVRYSKDKKTYTYFRSNPDGSVPLTGPGAPPACEFFLGAPVAGPTAVGNSPNCLLVGLYNLSDTYEGTRWDWRAVTDYRISEQLMAYASISTGYRGGGVNPRPFFGPSAGECADLPPGVAAPCNQLKTFAPETMTTYELGFKADLLENRLRLNGAVFLNKYSNIILTLNACPASPCLQPNNVGKADVKGFELETTFVPVDGLTFEGGISYLDFQYKSLTVPPERIAANFNLDHITPYTPELTYSFAAQYDFEMASGQLSARFDGSYQSKIYAQAINTAASLIDGYFLGNARLTYTSADEDWRVSLEVQNLFDKYYYLNVFDLEGSLGVDTGHPGLPRTWAVTVKRNF